MRSHRNISRVSAAKVLLLLVSSLSGCASLQAAGTATVAGARISFSQRGTAALPIVFQSGLGDDSAPWAAVFSELQARHHVFAYDRRATARATRHRLRGIRAVWQPRPRTARRGWTATTQQPGRLLAGRALPASLRAPASRRGGGSRAARSDTSAALAAPATGGAGGRSGCEGAACDRLLSHGPPRTGPAGGVHEQDRRHGLAAA